MATTNRYPKVRQERGSVHDFLSGGWGYDNREIWDPREPSVQQIDDMISSKDGMVRGLIQALVLPIQSAPRSIVPSERSDRTDRKVLDRVTDIFMRPAAEGGMKNSLDLIIAWMTGGFLRRRAYFEKVFGEFEGGLGYDKIAWRPATTCTLLRDPKSGDIIGYEQWIHNQATPHKFLKPYAMVYVHGQAQDPVRGVSDLDVAYWCWETKRKIAFLWFAYLEGQATPRTVVRGKGETVTKKAVQVMRGLRNNGVAGLPSSWIEGIDTINPPSTGSDEFMKAINWCDAEGAVSCLAGFMNLPSKASAATGSYALSKDSTDFYRQMQAAKSVELGGCFTTEAIVDIVRWNHGIPALNSVPQLKIGPLRPADIDTSIDLIKTLGTAEKVRVPDEFILQLVMEVARSREMDLDKLRAAIQAKADQLEQQFKMDQADAKAMAAANVGGSLVKSADQAGRRPGKRTRPAAPSGSSSPSDGQGVSRD